MWMMGLMGLRCGEIEAEFMFMRSEWIAEV
jgi:hypothetical protein